MKTIFSISISLIGLCAASFAFASATCPAPGSAEIVRHGKSFSATTIGNPKINLHTPTQAFTNEALYKIYKLDKDVVRAPKKFYVMTLSKESPYFISCSYDKGNFVLKTTGKKDFYDTNKTCKLVAVGKGSVQVTSIAAICMSQTAKGCQLVCQ